METMRKFLKRTKPLHWIVAVLLLLIVAAIGSASWFGYNQLTSLSTQLVLLESELESTTLLLENSILQSHNALSEALSKDRQKVSSIKQDVGSISGTVSDLEKLSKTDPELLAKYSKVYFLNENYIPQRLTDLPNKYEYNEQNRLQIHTDVWPYLENLLKEAKKDTVDLFIFSAYRSFDTQEALKGQYSIVYGVGANQFSADQGYSEHQLGTTVDFITTGIDGSLEGFENTGAYVWLLKNAHRFGFVLSYPQDNQFYVFEPWHWRFVGVDLATDLNSRKKHFYDLDQRELDTYLISFFD